MDSETSDALRAFTQRYCAAWQQQYGTDPRSEALYGVPSPCITRTDGEAVFWQQQPFPLAADLSGVEKAIEIVVQQPLQTYYTTQLAGDMQADFGGRQLMLLQAWSADDFLRVQENLIGHLVMQRRLKLSPTLFIATLESELDVISVCNLSGEVLLETVGTRRRSVLSASLASFLSHLEPAL
ncbi:TPA: SecY-interacting protein [Pluralibacter gergoviae]|uniref:Protein Syd n=1 Tax=Pluralibacter gergoviae TaxID=61647 RepID=A0A0J5PYL2_PLUGE|nr:SecY-interacting protein [Pluralibacter gergoviae]KMK15318.1 secretion protein [Pluralibacter gergoviae]KMK25207.1 secretion protein [Pluralibacter gergoviae]MBL3692262.1 SecY-interacting protein [Pluralibacter gergoviae]HDS1151497.1 SecY-interacting protein [Pluralibacter gergoviae]